MEQQVGYFRFLRAIEKTMRDAITVGIAIAGAISIPVWMRLSTVSSFCSGCGAGCAGAGCSGCGAGFGSSRYTAVTVRSLVTESNEVSHPANSYPSMTGASGAVAGSPYGTFSVFIPAVLADELDGIFVFRIYEHDILVLLVRRADCAGERVGSVGEVTV